MRKLSTAAARGAAAERQTVIEVPLALIDRPGRPLRQAMDPARLGELAESIRAVGVLQPLLVSRRGARYEVIFGDRRLAAARSAGLSTVPVMVTESTPAAALRAKLHENWGGETINPVDEARYFSELLTEFCHGDCDALVEAVGRSREHVEGRLVLLHGDPGVLIALERAEIGLGVARELNRIADAGWRAMYLDAARRGGASLHLVREWRQAAETAVVPALPDAGPGDNQVTTLPPARRQMTCMVCDSAEQPYDLDLVYVHRTCMARFIAPMLERLRELFQPSHQADVPAPHAGRVDH